MVVWGRIALVSCLIGCGTDADPFEGVVLESEHLRLHHAPQAPVCAGTLDYLERAATAQADLLELAIEPIDYWVFPPDRWVDGRCPGAVGCTLSGTTIHGSIPDLPHELAHAIELQHHPLVHPLFAEGVAVALGDDRPGQILSEYATPPVALLGAELTVGQYLLAGDFTSYLLASRGPADLDRLLDGAATTTAVARVRETFGEVYGMSIEEATDDRWRRGYRFGGGELKIPQCASAPIVWDGEALTEELTIDCADNGVGYDVETLGDLSRTNYVRSLRTLEVPAGGLYRLEVSQTAGNWLTVGWCPMSDDGDAPRDTVTVGAPRNGPAVALARLPAGRYFVEGFAAWPEPATIPWSLSRATESCDEPILVDADSPTIFAYPRPDEPIVLRLRFAEEAAYIPATQADEQAQITVCTDCTLADCVPADTTAWQPMSTDDEVVVVVESTVWTRAASVQFGGIGKNHHGPHRQ